jgi:hypothetical protein
VPEAAIHELHEGMTGEFAFTSRPRLKFPLRVTRVEPVAQVKESGNVFVLHCEVVGDPEPWWRPGMSGLAKIDAGKRSILWIFTYRTMDFLRMRLWW